MISVEAYHYGGYLVTDLVTDETILVQTDYDYPGLACTFGWSPSTDRCDCSVSPGTIQCPVCGTLPLTYINAAAEYLDGFPAPVEDPGYFNERQNNVDQRNSARVTFADNA